MDRRNFFKITSAAVLAGALPAGAQAAAANYSGTVGNRRCRVTVLRRECYTDLQSLFLDEPESGPCPLFNTGQQFEIDPAQINSMIARGEFCDKAWKCICSKIDSKMNDKCDSASNPDWSNTVIACCSDGTRPVVFKVELL